VGPDVTTNAYFIDRQSDDYASALRKNAYNQQLAVGSVSPSPVPPLQQLNISLSPSNHLNYSGTTGDHLLETHSVCAFSFYVTLIFFFPFLSFSKSTFVIIFY
jgi:hypothetical protein